MVWYGVGGRGGGTGWGGGGGGAGVCGEGWGPLELQLEKRPGIADKASIVRKPYASHKSYNYIGPITQRSSACSCIY